MIQFNYKHIVVALTLASSLLVAPTTRAQTLDRVRRQNGLDSGEITATTALGITLSRGGVESTIPAEDIRSVQWGGEPAALAAARNAFDAGRYADAVKMLAELDVPASARAEIQTDVAFYRALAAVRAAMDEAGDVAAAAKLMDDFLKGHAGSFHVAAAIEALGDALVAAGQYDAARTQFGKLAKAKSPYLAMRSDWLIGRAWQTEGDHVKALAAFAKARGATAQGALVDPLKVSIALDEAVSQAAGGKIADAARTLSDMIDKADAEDTELLARAYNALGDAYLAADDPRAALFAYLHVDLLYSQAGNAHAEALHKLVGIWRTLGRDARAQETADKLAKQYPNRHWPQGK